MAKSKKPYATWETKEEFEKHFEQIYNSGRESGFKEGLTTALSYILELLEDKFNDIDMQRNAEYVLSTRRKSEWKLRQSIIEYAKKKAVEEYLKSLEES